MDLYFEEPRPGLLAWRLHRGERDELLDHELLSTETAAYREALSQFQEHGPAALERLGQVVGLLLPPQVAGLLQREPMVCHLRGEIPWEVALLAGKPLAYQRVLTRAVHRADDEVVPLAGAPLHVALLSPDPCQVVPQTAPFGFTAHQGTVSDGVLFHESHGIVILAGELSLPRPMGRSRRRTAPRLVVLHGRSSQPASPLLDLGVDAVLAPAWEVPWAGAVRLLDGLFAALREGASLGEALCAARERCRDEHRTDLAYRLHGNPHLHQHELVPGRLELKGTRASSVRPAYTFHFLEGPLAGKRLPIFAAMQDRTLTMGGPGPQENDLELEDEQVPCRAITLVGDGGKLRLLGTPAVLLNGLPLNSSWLLEGGEVLELGETLLRVEAGPLHRPAPEPVSSEPLPRNCRFWLEQVEQRWPLGALNTLIGRSSDCDLVVHGATVSRQHCVVVQWEDDYYLRRLGSGLTLVNGLPVEGERRLRHGDRIQLGESQEWVFRDAWR